MNNIVFISSFGLYFYVQHFFDNQNQTSKKKNLVLIKRRSKVNKMNMLHDRALNFDQ